MPGTSPPLPNLDDQLGETRTASGAFTAWGKKQAKAIFLQRLRETGIIAHAMKAAGVQTRHTLDVWRAEDLDFKAAWSEAEAEAVDELEAAARKRAIEGFERPVYNDDGKVVRIMWEPPSDRLLEFYLKAKRPQQFNERFAAGNVLPPDDAAALIRDRLAQIESTTGT